MTRWRTNRGSSRVKRWSTLNSSSLSSQEPKMIFHNKKSNTINIRLLNFSCKHPNIYSLVVRTKNYKIEGAGLIPDGLANVFYLIHRLPKNHKWFFVKTSYDFSGRGPPTTRSKALYLEPLKVPAEHWDEAPFQVPLRIFFWECT